MPATTRNYIKRKPAPSIEPNEAVEVVLVVKPDFEWFVAWPVDSGQRRMDGGRILAHILALPKPASTSLLPTAFSVQNLTGISLGTLSLADRKALCQIANKMQAESDPDAPSTPSLWVETLLMNAADAGIFGRELCNDVLRDAAEYEPPILTVVYAADMSGREPKGEVPIYVHLDDLGNQEHHQYHCRIVWSLDYAPALRTLFGSDSDEDGDPPEAQKLARILDCRWNGEYENNEGFININLDAPASQLWSVGMADERMRRELVQLAHTLSKDMEHRDRETIDIRGQIKWVFGLLRQASDKGFIELESSGTLLDKTEQKVFRAIEPNAEV